MTQLVPPIPTEYELVRHVPGFDFADCVIVTGSVVAGFGHAYSDIDVYAFFATEERRDAVAEATEAVREPVSGTPVHGFYVQSQRWDVEFLSRDEVETVLQSVDTLEAAEQRGVTLSDIDLLYRISIARPAKGTPILARWQEQIRTSALSEVLKRRSLLGVDGQTEDALGLLAVGDVHAAAYCARMAFESMTDALLAADGRFCTSSKWRIHQLRQRPAGAITSEEYLDVVEMRQFRDASWVEMIIDRVRELALEA